MVVIKINIDMFFVFFCGIVEIEFLVELFNMWFNFLDFFSWVIVFFDNDV